MPFREFHVANSASLTPAVRWQAWNTAFYPLVIRNRTEELDKLLSLCAHIFLDNPDSIRYGLLGVSKMVPTYF